MSIGLCAAATLCACSAPGSNTPPAAVPGVTVLWSDVPAFADSTPDLATNDFFNDSADNSMTMEYHTSHAPRAVAAFYTNDLMAKTGWSPQPYDEVNHFSVGHGQGPQVPYGRTAGGCSEFEFHGKPAADCTFSKTDGQGRNVELTIFAGADDKSDKTLIDYTRFVGSAPRK